MNRETGVQEHVSGLAAYGALETDGKNTIRKVDVCNSAVAVAYMAYTLQETIHGIVGVEDLCVLVALGKRDVHYEGMWCKRIILSLSFGLGFWPKAGMMSPTTHPILYAIL